MDEVLRIENARFVEPWTRTDFIRLLRRGGTVGMIAEFQNQIVGYMVYQLEGSGIILLNIAVDPIYSRMSVGTQLIGRLKEKLSWQRRRTIGVEVTDRALGAQRFFASQGFVAVAAFGPDCEIYGMVYRLLPNRGPEAAIPKNRITEFLKRNWKTTK